MKTSMPQTVTFHLAFPPTCDAPPTSGTLPTSGAPPASGDPDDLDSTYDYELSSYEPMPTDASLSAPLFLEPTESSSSNQSFQSISVDLEPSILPSSCATDAYRNIGSDCC